MNSLGKRDCINKKLPKSFKSSKAGEDRRYGDVYEKRFETLINNWCNCKFNGGTTGWEQIDFINKENKIGIEIKRRRIRKFQYPTIMISYSKYTAARKLMLKGYKVYFFWKFTDRLCFWQVPTIIPPTIKIRNGGTFRRGYDETNDCMYIPMEDLNDFNEYPTYIDYMETKTITNV